MIRPFVAAKKEPIVLDISGNSKKFNKRNFESYKQARSRDKDIGQDFETLLKHTIEQISTCTNKSKKT